MKPSSLRLSPPLASTRHALFLDFDGTLVEHAEHPDRAVVPDQLIATLIGLERRLGDALAVVTGRRLESLDAKLAPLRLRAAGLYGAQLRADPAAEPVESRTLAGLHAQMRAAFASEPRIWIEDKGAAVAVHYAEVPARAADIRAALVAASAGLRVDILLGRGVIEAVAGGHGKDVAIRRLMREAPFRNRIPIFLGDDLSDEAGIREVQTLGGIGIKVGAGESAAEWRLAGTGAVYDWLRESLWSLPDV